jgi:hypothetical protein
MPDVTVSLSVKTSLMVKKFERVGKVLYFRFRMFMMSNGFGPDSILARDNLDRGRADRFGCGHRVGQVRIIWEKI